MSDTHAFDPNDRESLQAQSVQHALDVELHKTSIRQRCEEHLRENPPAEPLSQTGLTVYADHLGKEILTGDEQDLYADMQLELEEELDAYEDDLHELRATAGDSREKYAEYEQTLDERDQLIEDTHHARGVCTPAERQQAAVEAIRQHNLERTQVRAQLVEQQSFDDGTDFSRYEVAEAELDRADYPGPTPADDKIHTYLSDGSHPSNDPELARRFDYIAKEFGERTDQGERIPEDFRAQLRERERDRLVDFVAEHHGEPVEPAENTEGVGRYVASVNTHATDHHVIQDEGSGRTVVVDGKDQPDLAPGHDVKVTASSGRNGQVQLSVAVRRQKEASADLAR